MDGLKFSIGLEDNVSGAARSATSSLASLQTELKAGKAQLATYQSQMRLAKQLGDDGAMQHFKELAAGARVEVYGLTNAIIEMGGATKAAGEKTSGALAVLEGMSLEKLGEKALEFGAKFLEMSYEVIKGAVEMALEVTSVNERLTATFQALGAQGENSGAKTLAFLNDLSTQLPQSRDQLAQWTKQYEALGITNLDELRHQILATASAQAIMGDQGAEAYKRITERVNLAVEAHHGLKLAEKSLKSLYEAGVNVSTIAQKMGVSVQQLSAGLKAGTVDAQKFGNALSDTLIEKGKGPLEAMGNELGTLKQKGLETLGHLFDGIDTAPLLDAIKNVIHLGDSGTPTGNDLKSGITAGINGVIKALGAGITQAEIFFLDLGTSALNTVALFRPLLDILAKLKIASFDAGTAVKGLGEGFRAGLSTLGGFAAGGVAGGIQAGVGAAAGLAQGPTPAAPDEKGGWSTVGPGGKLAPANAEGGLVGKPAPGEAFASVAPGEVILSRDNARQVTGNAQSPSEAASASSSQGGAGGGKSVQIGTLHLTVQGQQGVTDATSLSVTGLTLALERMQLASGR